MQKGYRIKNVVLLLLSSKVKLIDVLRFADLLSKSDDPKKAELHHTWAQEIIALAEELYGETALLKVYKDSILSSTGNYQGLDLRFERNPEYLVPRYDPLEQMYFEYSKELYQIPSEPDKYFFHVQKGIYDHFEDQYVSYSAPTSLGKSYLMRLLIKEKIQNGEKCNFAILVPTKALINEVTEKLTNELESLLQEQDYRIVNSAGALALKDKTHHFIFVVTPERMLYVMSDPEAVPIDYMFVDEAHKISERDGRSAFYYKVVQMAVQNKTKKAHVFFASPSIANPEVFFRVIPEWERQQDFSLATQYAPVSQEKFIVDFRENGIYIVNDRKDEIERVAGLPEGLEWIDFLFETGSGMRNIVYCSGRDSGIRNARLYAEKLDPLNIQELDELSDLIKETVHEDYYLAGLVKKGVAYHMGYLPTTIRMRIEELYRENKIKTIFCTRADIMASIYSWESFIRIHGGEPGARDVFEKAMDELLRAENPGKEVHVVKAAPGDGGIDVYVHHEDGIDIYQCKFFMGLMDSSRWNQIYKSFSKAMEPKGVKVLRWVLCMPREMQQEDIAKWDEFMKERSSYGVEI